MSETRPTMLSLEEAQARLLALAPQTEVVELTVMPVSHRRWLAHDHRAQRTQPSADLSAMDGYAIGPGDGPWQRVGESRAGAPFDGGIGPGECTRISTGAHMPQGADRVLIQENAAVDGSTISTEEPPEAGRHVRRAGFDFAEGEVVLAKGTPLTPASKALAIAAGIEALSVREAPRVAVLDSGDELVVPGRACAPHQIPASNAAMLGAMLYPYVSLCDQLGPVPDDAGALAEALDRASDAEILITSGGASVGDHDLIQQALVDWGAELDFWKVAIKPGKPLMVATKQQDWGQQVVLGLPGNPVSSYVTALLFALPLVRAALGAPDPLPASLTIAAGEALPAVGPRREFLRAVIQNGEVRRVAEQDSSALKALASANCLIDRPANAPAVSPGERLRVFALEDG